MHSFHQIARSAAAFAVVASATVGALAVPVTPGGGTTPLPGITAAADPALVGAIIADKVDHWVSADDPRYGFPGAEGSLQSRVVRETGTGTLDFYWRVDVDQPSYPNFVPTELEISNLPLARFLTGAAYDADYRLDGTGDSAPSGAFATVANAFHWEFDSSLGPSTSTFFLLLRSNATLFDDSAIASLGVSSFDTFAPAATIDEPREAALLLAGLLACGALWKRQRRGATD